MYTKIMLPVTAAALLLASAASVHAQGEKPKQMSPWGDYLAGYHAESIGDAKRALDFYGAAQRLGLEDQADLSSRVYILGLTEGRLDGALKALAQAENSGAKAPLSALTKTVHALRNADYKKTLELLAEDEGGITRILAPVLTAWAHVGNKDFTAALKALEPDAGNDNPTPLLSLHAALILDIAGETAKADAKFNQLREDAGVSVRTAQLIGQHLERAGKPDQARALYEALGQDAEREILLAGLDARIKTKRRPALGIATPQHGGAEALYGVASALLAQNAWESALALSRMATQLRPNFPPSALVAAAALQQNARYEDANALYATVPESSPFSWLARLNMADNLDRMDKTDEAVALLNTMAKQQPHLSKALIQMGDIERRHERFKKAITAYSQALSRIGTPGEDHWGLLYSRGIAYEQTKQWPKAEADFLKALELSPDQPLVLNYLGYSWIDQGMHLKQALEMIEKAVEKRPRDGYIVDSLGWGLYRTGDFAGAVKHLERAVMLRPADAVINDHFGDALWQVGRVREARFQWERAMNMEPDAELAKAIEKKLQSGLAATKP